MAGYFCQPEPADVSTLQNTLIALHEKSWKMLH
jgi:hypothetical protein